MSEIDVINIIRRVLSEKRLLAKFVGVFAVLGIIVALARPKQYTAEVVLAPEMSAGGLGMSETLADMASTFGINIGGKSSYDAIYPEIYPEVFASTTFVMGLTEVPIRSLDNPSPRSYRQHLVQETKVPFWAWPRIWIAALLAKKPSQDGGTGDDGPSYMTKDETELCGAIRGAITCTVSSKNSLITITVKDQDPMVAAIMADTIQQRLQEYITEYRTQKARIDVEYYEQLLAESRKLYKEAQERYATYTDGHQNLSLARFSVKHDDLENEMQLMGNTMTQISAQLQQAKAKVQERTPAFMVIQPATLPYKASSTPRSLVVFFFLCLGVLADVVWVMWLRRK